MKKGITLTTLKNLTPHPLTIRATRGDILNIPPEPTPARLTTTKAPRPPLTGVVDVPIEIGVSEVTFGTTENLPAPTEGAAYIVSGLVLAQHPDRADLFAPGELVRESAYTANELGDVLAALELCDLPEALIARVLGALKGAQGRVIAADGLSCTPAYGVLPPAPEPAPQAPESAPPAFGPTLEYPDVVWYTDTLSVRVEWVSSTHVRTLPALGKPEILAVVVKNGKWFVLPPEGPERPPHPDAEQNAARHDAMVKARVAERHGREGQRARAQREDRENE